MLRNRIKGGEKTPKSGKKWSREELQKVLNFYEECKNAIHENNPRIQEIGKELGRATRAVEAQFLMYRALEKRDNGETYSHHKYNKICKELWELRKDNCKEQVMIDEVEIDDQDGESVVDMAIECETSTGGLSSEHSPVGSQFLIQLLELQQDGSGAISSPKDWAKPPLLEVPTDQDKVVERIKDTTIRSGGNTGEWLCWVGSPGNGKSASTGKYYRLLKDNYNFKFRKDGKLVDILSHEPNGVPYRIEVSRKGEKHSICWIIQDASALREKYCEKAEPARDLLEELKEAYVKGVSLIICTNRGVLEAAHNLVISEDQYQEEDAWKKVSKVIKTFISGDKISSFSVGPDNPRAPFKKVAISTAALDNSSLLLNSNAFSKLIDKAVDPERWSACSSCGVAGYCPWKLNRDTLADNVGKESTLQILSQAEAFDGQVIVFRGALAFLSYLLSGCPRDYSTNENPCEWAHRKFSEKDYFSLLSRRIYMQFFSSPSPDGLEQEGGGQAHQLQIIKGIVNGSGDLEDPVKTTLKKVLNRKARVSTNVGLNWMLGFEGVLSRLDPLLAPWSQDMLNSWGGDTDALTRVEGPFVTELEKACGAALAALEDSIESGDSNENKQEQYRELRRWISSITMRLGGFKDVKTAWAYELNAFIEILKISQTPVEQRTEEERLVLFDFEDQLNQAFDPTPNDGFVPANANFEISNVSDDLKPTIEDDQGENILLSVEMGKEKALLSGELVIALSSIGKNGLLRSSAPEESMMKIVDIRDRAAASVDYAFRPSMRIRVEGEGSVLHRRGNSVSAV